MKKQQQHYTPGEKVAILRRHLLDKEPISKLCDEPGLPPTVFYRWQKECFENGASAFEQKARPSHSAEQERIAYPARPKSAPGGSSGGSTSPPASSTIGGTATAR